MRWLLLLVLAGGCCSQRAPEFPGWSVQIPDSVRNEYNQLLATPYKLNPTKFYRGSFAFTNRVPDDYGLWEIRDYHGCGGWFMNQTAFAILHDCRQWKRAGL